MIISKAEVVGRFTIRPERVSDFVGPKGAHPEVICDFQALAAKLLGCPASRVSLLLRPGSSNPDRALVKPGRWHTDTYAGPECLICVLGPEPTEFLLGEYADEYVAAPERLGELEGVLSFWRPAEAEVVLLDRRTVHRRPRLTSRHRVFLLASKV